MAVDTGLEISANRIKCKIPVLGGTSHISSVTRASRLPNWTALAGGGSVEWCVSGGGGSARPDPSQRPACTCPPCFQLWILPSILGSSVLHFLSDDHWETVSAWIYGLGLCGLFVVSTVFHTVSWKKSHLRYPLASPREGRRPRGDQGGG